MKRKLFTALVILVSFAFTACQQDEAMDNLIVDTQATLEHSSLDATQTGGNTGSGGTGDDPDDEPPSSGN